MIEMVWTCANQHQNQHLSGLLLWPGKVIDETTGQIGTICSQVLKRHPFPPPHKFKLSFVQVRWRGLDSPREFFTVAAEHFSALSSLYLLFCVGQIYEEAQLRLREDPLTWKMPLNKLSTVKE